VRPIPALRQAARSLSPRASIWHQLHTFRRDKGFSASLRCLLSGFLAHLSPARDALSFLFAFGVNFASAAATINSQVELMEGFAATSRALSGGSYLPLIIFLLLYPLCKRSSVPFPRKTVFSHPSRFQFWQGQENPSNLPNELLSLVHLRTLATQNDHFSCGFSSLSHCYFSCICRGKTPSVLSLHRFTALHAFMKIYNGGCEQTVKNLGS